jgi:hypothetical protein
MQPRILGGTLGQKKEKLNENRQKSNKVCRLVNSIASVLIFGFNNCTMVM